MKLRILAALLCLLLLTACGKQGEQFSTEVITTGGDPPTEDAPVPETEPEDQPESGTAAGIENLFEAMPGTFRFSSGAGAWSTELYLETDGSFSGLFVDSDMGVSGEDYPDGTRYVCVFGGQFSQPEPVDETTWSMKIESMELEHPADGAEEYADGVRYVYSEPYGLEDTEELLVYGPEAPAADLPEYFLNWIWGPYGWSPTEEGTLGIWGIYNAGQGYGFTAFE